MKFSLGSCKAVEVSEVHIVSHGDTVVHVCNPSTGGGKEVRVQGQS